ncbi:Type 1 glutamine amidotransferase-like domain-containing protein [Nesterenkonia marinintestina]|uniref:Type 1 glutamine amidotransferase-like domain-containing protein n=1 Tax=Nesterenkonia marinintestina TaxID=2979865 RepID=UPI0021BE2BBA|nr:Type 1 glutamine amidotransferase-like domain-containing protein [Nesterenkonia sp. GX14115]
MDVLLLSVGVGAVPAFLEESLPDAGSPVRIAYVDDAAAPFTEEAFVSDEREQLAGLGYELRDVTAGRLTPEDLLAVLDEVDAVYVAGGHTFVLLHALRSSGADQVLLEAVRGGLPYIGASAGAVVAGPSTEPISLMDDPGQVPELTDLTGLGLVGDVVVPHADGNLAPYPAAVIGKVVETYDADFPLVLLPDDHALIYRDGARHMVDSP